MGTPQATDPASRTKIAEGREAEMFDWPDGRVLRLYRPGYQAEAVESQVKALEGARSAGVRVPVVYERVEVGGRLGIVMERIAGTDLLTIIGRQPWRVWWVGGVTGRTHAAVNDATAPADFVSTHDRMRQRLTTSPLIPPDLRDRALERLEQLPEGDSLLHGDFHPGNLMVDRGEPVVLDWTNVTRGNPEGDVARTLLMIKLGEPPPGTSLVLRVLARVGRRILLSAYTRAYGRTRAPDSGLLKRWELPVAVTRLSEGIAEERAALLRFIAARL